MVSTINQVNKAFLERQGKLLFQALGVIDFLKITFLFDIVTNDRFGSSATFRTIIVFLIFSSIIPAYFAWRKKYAQAVQVFAFATYIFSIVISLFIPYWLILVFSLHLISATIITMILGEKKAQIYTVVALLTHGLIYFLRWQNIITISLVEVDSLLTIVSLCVLLFMNGSLTYIVVRGLSNAVYKSIESEFKLKESNQLLQEQIEQKEQFATELEAEQALLERRVEERTADLATVAQKKDEFLASMSHELRTPLNTILGRTQALNFGIYGKLTDRQAQTIDGIETSGQHLLSLINDILDVSKIVAGEMTIRLSPINVKEVCEEVLSAIRPLTKEKSLNLVVNYHHGTNIIFAERRRLKQILLNLLSNAVKFTPDGKSIGINISESVEDRHLIMTVWDKGIGIPIEKQSQLFQPFVQVENGLARKYSGTGLGLALVKQLVDLHNGSIELESFAGEGSYFIVTLPFNTPESLSEEHPIALMDITS